MLHNGPIPYFVHGALDYVLGALLIAAPFIFNFSGIGSATAVAIIAGVIVLVLAGSTDGPMSLTNGVPLSLHVLVDVLAGAFFIASPFLFGFSNDSNGAPTAFFIALGVVELLLVVGTRFPREHRSLRS